MAPPVVPASHLRALVLAGIELSADSALSAAPAGHAARERLARSLGWAAHLAGAGADLIPLPLVHDLGWLLLDGASLSLSAVSAAPERWSPGERALRIGYQRGVLVPLLRAPWFDEVRRAARDAAAVDEVVARFLAIVHQRLAAAAADALVPTARALPRDLLALAAQPPSLPWDPAHERAELARLIGYDPASDPDPLGRWFHDAADRLARIGSAALLDAADRFELANLPAFATATERAAARRLAALEATIPPFSPSRLAARREAHATVETSLPDTGSYPQGGLAEIARGGTIENLVRSELIYAGEEAIPGVDWFTLRLLENDLLHYRRDESQLQRTRRTLHLALVTGPEADARLPGHPHGPAAYLEALLVSIGRAGRTLFARDSLAIVVSVGDETSQGEEQASAQQARRLALSLRMGRRRNEPVVERHGVPDGPRKGSIGAPLRGAMGPGPTHLVRLATGTAASLTPGEQRAYRAAGVEVTVVALDHAGGSPDVVLTSARPLGPQLGPARDAVLERLVGQGGTRVRARAQSAGTDPGA